MFKFRSENEVKHETFESVEPVEILKITAKDIVKKFRPYLHSDEYVRLVAQTILLVSKIGFKKIIKANLSPERKAYKTNHDKISSYTKVLQERKSLPTSHFNGENLETPLDLKRLISGDSLSDLDYILDQLQQPESFKNTLNELIKENPIACVGNQNSLFPGAFLIIQKDRTQNIQSYEAIRLSLELVSHSHQKQNHVILGIHNLANASKIDSHEQFAILEDFEIRPEFNNSENSWPCNNPEEYTKIINYINDMTTKGYLISEVYLDNNRIGIVEHNPLTFSRSKIEQIYKCITGFIDNETIEEITSEIYIKVGLAGFEVAGNIVVDNSDNLREILYSWLKSFNELAAIDISNGKELSIEAFKRLQGKVAVFRHLFGISYIPELETDNFSNLTEQAIKIINQTVSVLRFTPELYLAYYCKKITRVVSPESDFVNEKFLIPSTQEDAKLNDFATA